MISVVVCAKNEAQRIAGALDCIQATGDAWETVVVDGGSTDGTADIARLRGVEVIVSANPSLSHDRQLGVDATHGRWVAFIDADHRVPPGALTEMTRQCEARGYAVAQARLRIVHRSFWNHAEDDLLCLTHTPGARDMVGVAPAVFRREVFAQVRFADGLLIDDTDFMYRLHRDTDYATGIVDVPVWQEHDPRLRDYWRKWRWYGRGDGEFKRLHPERAASMNYHLLVRYPVVHSWRALRAGRWRVAPFAVLQGLARFVFSLT